jgi:hypothetical protein
VSVGVARALPPALAEPVRRVGGRLVGTPSLPPLGGRCAVSTAIHRLLPQMLALAVTATVTAAGAVLILPIRSVR